MGVIKTLQGFTYVGSKALFSSILGLTLLCLARARLGLRQNKLIRVTRTPSLGLGGQFPMVRFRVRAVGCYKNIAGVYLE